MQIDGTNKQFQDVLAMVQYTNQSIFLTGKAGTGKSTLLKYLCQHTKKKYVVLAPTGVAAINAEGCTLHSFFKLPFHPLLPDDPRFCVKGGKLREYLKYTSEHRKLIEKLELVIIDEISMVRADIIDFIDKVLRYYSHNMRVPFGGKQLLLVGDMYQLEPVVTSDERDILSRFYPVPFFFAARVFKSIPLVSIELQKVYRQQEPAFINILNHIRNNTVTDIDLRLLNTRYNEHATPHNDDQLHITLTTRRDTANYINTQELERLPGSCIGLKGHVQGEFPENSLPTLMQLDLKVGAQVIFIKNDAERRWVNGTIATVSAISESGDSLWIVTEDGNEYCVEQEVWRNIRYSYNEQEGKVEETELGTFTQFPIRLAWAITVHKSQGLTFNHVIIDFSGGTFTGGQTYVALSRCTTLDGIQLRTPIRRSDIFVRPEIVAFAQSFNNKQAYDQAMQASKADMAYHEATIQFDAGHFKACLDAFFVAIHARYDIEKPLARRFIQYKLGIIHKLKAENKKLKERMEEQNRMLQQLAKEYYAMGNECVTQAHNAQAAIANYDKAIRLYPQYVDAWVRKGVTFQQEGDSYKALESLNHALEISPNNFKAILNKGKVLMDTEHLDEAKNMFLRATSIKEEHPAAYRYLSEICTMQGDEEQAAIFKELAKRYRDKKK